MEACRASGHLSQSIPITHVEAHPVQPHPDQSPATPSYGAASPAPAPAAIQPWGCLLCLDGGLNRVLQVSANLAEVLGVAVEEALARSPAQLLGARRVDRLRAALAADGGVPDMLRRRRDGRPVRFQLRAYASDGCVVVEIEPLAANRRDLRLAGTGQWLGRLARAESEEALLELLSGGVRALTGHERVMVQRLEPDGAATVLAEALAPGVAGATGQRLPPGQVPPGAASCHPGNPLHCIPDLFAPPVALVPPQGPGGAAPPDLSPGVLRAPSPEHRRHLRELGVGAILSLPLQDGGAPWGLVTCHGSRPLPLSPGCRDAALALAGMASQRLFLLRARAEAAVPRPARDRRPRAELAHVDALTHSWNRYRIELELERELSAAERYGRPCALLLFDLDHLKTLNDAHGEAAGDRLLCILAATVAGNLRPTDHLGRWDGGAFAVVAGNTSRGGALGLAERLRTAVAALRLDGLGPVTISIGVAERIPGDSAKSLVARAGRALRRAKAGGRNRAVADALGSVTGG